MPRLLLILLFFGQIALGESSALLLLPLEPQDFVGTPAQKDSAKILMQLKEKWTKLQIERKIRLFGIAKVETKNPEYLFWKDSLSIGDPQLWTSQIEVLLSEERSENLKLLSLSFHDLNLLFVSLEESLSAATAPDLAPGAFRKRGENFRLRSPSVLKIERKLLAKALGLFFESEYFLKEENTFLQKFRTWVDLQKKPNLASRL